MLANLGNITDKLSTSPMLELVIERHLIFEGGWEEILPRDIRLQANLGNNYCERLEFRVG